jgi:hypothetical protein
MSATFLHSIREAGESGELVVLDRERRLYAGTNRDGTGWHVIQPARPDDPRVGDGLRQAGQLVCTCAGGTFRGTCYRTVEAERFEAERADHAAAPTWLREPAPETELEKAATRG